jgi:hypothetical protein
MRHLPTPRAVHAAAPSSTSPAGTPGLKRQLCRWLAGAACAAAAWPAVAAFSPETAGTVHFDLKPPGQYQPLPAFGGLPPGPIVPVVGGPCGRTSVVGYSFFACSFNDALNAPARQWIWETEINNPSLSVRSMNVGFFFPGGPILGRLTLGGNSTFHIGIDLQDGLFLPETGTSRVWYAWRGSYPIRVDGSIVENIVPGGTNGSFLYHFHSSPEDSFVRDDTLTIDQLDFTFRDPGLETVAVFSVPEPSTPLMLAAGLGVLVHLRRRHGPQAR